MKKIWGGWKLDGKGVKLSGTNFTLLLMYKNTAITYLGIGTKVHHTIKDTGFTAHTRWSPRRAYKKPSEWCTILNSAFSFKEEFCSKTTIFFCVDTFLPIF